MLLDFEDEEGQDDGFATYEPVEPEGLKPPRDSSLFLGHDGVQAQILEIINSGAIPHAMIFSGQKGIGKATFAFRLARYLLKNGVVDTAQDSLFGGGDDLAAPATTLDIPTDDPVFAKVASGGHPDLLVVERQTDPKTGQIKSNLDVQTARKVVPFLRMTSSDGGWRIVIVDDADLMNRNAQNALLKILEEPPQNTLLILVAHRLGAMIPTIRSRCRAVHFQALGETTLSQLLEYEVAQTISSHDRELLGSLTGGSVGMARDIIDTGGLETMRTLLNMWQDWPDFNLVEVHNFANQLSRGKAADNLFDNVEHFFLWMTRVMAFAKAKNTTANTATGDSLPVALRDSESFTNMLSQFDLLKWVELADQTKAHFHRARHSNLDKKQAVLEAFMMWGS